MGNAMDMYGMEIYAETRVAERRDDADIRRLLRAARAPETDGSAAWWRRWLRPGTARPSTPQPEAS